MIKWNKQKVHLRLFLRGRDEDHLKKFTEKVAEIKELHPDWQIEAEFQDDYRDY